MDTVSRVETHVKGRSFALDMTYAANERNVDTYLGFDFGTSTSSLCYVRADEFECMKGGLLIERGLASILLLEPFLISLHIPLLALCRRRRDMRRVSVGGEKLLKP